MQTVIEEPFSTVKRSVTEEISTVPDHLNSRISDQHKGTARRGGPTLTTVVIVVLIIAVVAAILVFT